METNVRRVLTTQLHTEDHELEPRLRPDTFEGYIGQEKAKANMKVYIEAAKMRGETLDHVLLYGPPGLGKTTLSNIISNQAGVGIKTTSGPAIERPGDIAAVLNDLQHGDILFIDEIHRLQRVVEEVLYPAMEDFAIDILIGKGAGAKSVRLDLPRFTLIGATTRIGLLSAPLRDRFGVVMRLEPYSVDELELIMLRSAGVLGIAIDRAGAREIAQRARATPRIANRLLKRVRDFAQVRFEGRITSSVARESLDILEVDRLGLDNVDRRLLEALLDKFAGGPVGLDTLATAIGEDSETIEEVYEPFLIQLGLLARTPRGRVATPLCYGHFGRPCTSNEYGLA